MKFLHILFAAALTLTATLTSADWKEEVNALVGQVKMLTTNEAGQTDSERFQALIMVGWTPKR